MPGRSLRQGAGPNLSRIRKSGLLPALLACALAAGAQATGTPGDKPVTEAVCPWLTSGTAANALGGEVTASVTGTTTEGSCRFVRRDAVMDSLEVHVGAAGLRGCPPGSTPLPAIGNEAERCRVQATAGSMEEMASGRVRDVHFTVTLSMRGDRRNGKPADSAQDPLARIADQVAGNLY